MPTDGADFGRTKACYGRVYTALRLGADNGDVAELVVRGVERDIRRDGGVPAFKPVLQLLVVVSVHGLGKGAEQLIRNIDALARQYGASSLSRDVLSAAERVGVEAINNGTPLFQLDAAKCVLENIMLSRCDGMSGYITRHRTDSVAETESILEAVSQKVSCSLALDDLAGRMLNPSAKGLPAKAPKGQSIDHSAEGLNNTSLEEGL